MSIFGNFGDGAEKGAPSQEFIGIIDKLVLMSENDEDLAEGLRWIDAQASKHGNTFYEEVLNVLRKHTAEKKAEEWSRSKLNGE